MPWYLIVIIAVLGAAAAGYIVWRASLLFRRAEELIDEVKQADELERETPKSLNAMDRLLLPQILKDFPEYNAAVIRDRVIRDARLFFESAAAGKPLFKTGVSTSFVENLVLPEGVKGGVVVHRTALAHYDRSGRDRIITYQASCQYDGTDEKHHQTRLVLRYIAAHSDDFSEKIEVIKCPNCSAPVPTVGEKICPYCGAALKAPAGAGWVLISAVES